ncbi:MAG: DoxX family protein [Candidatus Babeliales bacterium]
MNGIKEILLSNSTWAKDIGLLIIRLGLGGIFIKHGFGKVIGGYENWRWIGSQMSNLGITFWPIFWGLCAAVSEFFGGIALTLGLATRLAAFLISCVMLVAILYHIGKGDEFSTLSHPLSLMFVFWGIIFAGGGRFSLDYFLR